MHGTNEVVDLVAVFSLFAYLITAHIRDLLRMEGS